MKMSDKSKNCIEKTTGLSYEKILNMSYDDEVKYLKTQCTKTVSFSKKYDYRKSTRGSSLLALGRIKTIDDVNKEINRILR